MGGPQDGKYNIQLAADPKPLIGVDTFGGDIESITTDGNDNVWTVAKKADGKYTFVLEQTKRALFIQDKGGKLVGNIKSPASTWSVEGPDGGPYTIKVLAGSLLPRAWTVENSSETEAPVVITSLSHVVQPNQQWNFVRWTGPE